MATAHEVDDAATLAAVRIQHQEHIVRWEAAELAERLARWRGRHCSCRRGPDLELVLENRVIMLFALAQHGKFDEMNRQLEVFDAEANRLGDPHWRAYGFTYRGARAAQLGRFAEADTFFEEAMRCGEQAQTRNVRMVLAVTLLGVRRCEDAPMNCLSCSNQEQSRSSLFARCFRLSTGISAAARGGPVLRPDAADRHTVSNTGSGHVRS
ncbi:MAG: hypothetical protein U5Q44_10655 [Dehalococcoidia bacterium]|nr:hypothetical protein [Dehalococcoidia bacterium]